jgi:hypothetical protein
MELRWARTYENGASYVESVGGVDWASAGIPPRWHFCWTQTRAQLGDNYTERCPCGGWRDSRRGRWARRNETRTARRRDRREARLPLVTVTCGDCGAPYEARTGTPIAREKQCNRCWCDALVQGVA